MGKVMKLPDPLNCTIRHLQAKSRWLQCERCAASLSDKREQIHLILTLEDRELVGVGEGVGWFSVTEHECLEPDAKLKVTPALYPL